MIKIISSITDFVLKGIVLRDSSGNVVEADLVRQFYFKLGTTDTPKERYLTLTSKRLVEGSIFLDSSELKSLENGQMLLEIYLILDDDNFVTDNSYDSLYIQTLGYYLKKVVHEEGGGSTGGDYDDTAIVLQIEELKSANSAQDVKIEAVENRVGAVETSLEEVRALVDEINSCECTPNYENLPVVKWHEFSTPHYDTKFGWYNVEKNREMGPGSAEAIGYSGLGLNIQYGTSVKQYFFPSTANEIWTREVEAVEEGFTELPSWSKIGSNYTFSGGLVFNPVTNNVTLDADAIPNGYDDTEIRARIEEVAVDSSAYSNAKYDELVGKIGEVKTYAEGVNSQALEAYSMASDNATAISGITERVGALENKPEVSLDGYATEDYVDNQFGTLDGRFNEALQVEVGVINGRIDGMDERVGALENKPEVSLDGYATEEYVDNKIDGVSETVANSLVDLHNEIEDNEQATSASINGLDERISTLEGDSTNVWDELNRYGDITNDHESRISTLESNAGSGDVDLSGVESRLDALEYRNEPFSITGGEYMVEGRNLNWDDLHSISKGDSYLAYIKNTATGEYVNVTPGYSNNTHAHLSSTPQIFRLTRYDGSFYTIQVEGEDVWLGTGGTVSSASWTLGSSSSSYWNVVGDNDSFRLSRYPENDGYYLGIQFTSSNPERLWPDKSSDIDVIYVTFVEAVTEYLPLPDDEVLMKYKDIKDAYATKDEIADLEILNERVTALEENGGSGGSGDVDLSGVESRLDALEYRNEPFDILQEPRLSYSDGLKVDYIDGKRVAIQASNGLFLNLKRRYYGNTDAFLSPYPQVFLPEWNSYYHGYMFTTTDNDDGELYYLGNYASSTSPGSIYTNRLTYWNVEFANESENNTYYLIRRSIGVSGFLGAEDDGRIYADKQDGSGALTFRFTEVVKDEPLPLPDEEMLMRWKDMQPNYLTKKEIEERFPRYLHLHNNTNDIIKIGDENINGVVTRLHIGKAGSYNRVIGRAESIDNFQASDVAINLDDVRIQSRMGNEEDLSNLNRSSILVTPIAVSIDTSNFYLNGMSVSNALRDIKSYKTPNLALFGDAFVGPVGDLWIPSPDAYAKLPFMLNLTKPFVLRFGFVSDNPFEQHNIIDSQYGLAIAVRDEHLVAALSTNGQTFDLGEMVVDSATIEPGVLYDVEFIWTGSRYILRYRNVDVDGVWNYAVKESENSLYPTEIIIGKGINNDENRFEGQLFLDRAILFENMDLQIFADFDEDNDEAERSTDEFLDTAIVLWQGYDLSGLSTRLMTNLDNIDEAGVNRIKGIAGSCSEIGDLYNLINAYETRIADLETRIAALES